MKKWIALGALLAMPATAIAQEAEEMAADESAVQAEIAALSVEFAAAVSGDDPVAAADFYTEDAVIMPPGMDVVSGREALVEFFGQGMDGATLALETWAVHTRGDAALETGGYTITGSDGAHLDHGKYMVGWLETEDGWKMTVDIWNSSMAPTADQGQE